MLSSPKIVSLMHFTFRQSVVFVSYELKTLVEKLILIMKCDKSDVSAFIFKAAIFA